MTIKRRERKPSTISVEHSTAPGERAVQHPRRVSPEEVAGFGNVQVSRPQRFRNGKLVAVGGIPVTGQTIVADADAFAENSAGDILSEWIDDGNQHVSGWEHHAMQMYMDGNDQGTEAFLHLPFLLTDTSDQKGQQIVEACSDCTSLCNRNVRVRFAWPITAK